MHAGFVQSMGLPSSLSDLLTYGPGQDAKKPILYVILSLLRGQAPQLSSGHQEFDWIYVDDVIDGLIRAGHVPCMTDGTIDLGSGRLVPIRRVVRRLVAPVDSGIERVFGAVADRPFERTRVANIAEAYVKVGRRPMTLLETGLERMVSCYRTHLEDGEAQA